MENYILQVFTIPMYPLELMFFCHTMEAFDMLYVQGWCEWKSICRCIASWDACYTNGNSYFAVYIHYWFFFFSFLMLYFFPVNCFHALITDCLIALHVHARLAALWRMGTCLLSRLLWYRRGITLACFLKSMGIEIQRTEVETYYQVCVSVSILYPWNRE